MRKIIYMRPDGGLSVVHPVRNTHPVPESITDAEIEQRAWDKLPADAINPVFVDPSEIPSDRTFRNAWKQNAGKVEHDMAKCRDLWRAHLRVLRKPKLEALDAEYMRADEIGDTGLKAQIAAQKQVLRDVTVDPAIDAAQTPQALKQFLPAVLR